MSAQAGTCPKCERPGRLLTPLHGEKGGALLCLECGMDWHAKNRRRETLRRTAIRALRAYRKAVGWKCDFDRIRMAACGMAIYEADEVNGTQPGEMTLELLEDAIRLCHPDRHPPEREDTARRVTQGLLALKPYIYPEEKPEPPKPSDGSIPVSRVREKKPLRINYPCELCAEELPSNYCAACKAKHEEQIEQRRTRWQTAKERRRTRARERYRERKQAKEFWQAHKHGLPTCETCAKEYRQKRKDSKYCSAACRQKAHRERVTAKTFRAEKYSLSRNEASA